MSQKLIFYPNFSCAKIRYSRVFRGNAPRTPHNHKFVKKLSPRLPVGLKICVLQFSTIYVQNQALN